MGRVLLGLYVEPIGLLPSDGHQFQFVLGVDDVALILRFDPLGWDGPIVGGFGQMKEGGCGGVGLEGVFLNSAWSASWRHDWSRGVFTAAQWTYNKLDLNDRRSLDFPEARTATGHGLGLRLGYQF